MSRNRSASAAMNAAAAFRLVNELEGLIRGIAADQVIHPDEVDRLRRWLAEVAAWRHVEPFKNLSLHIDRVLADGVVTMDECDDLLYVTARLTTVNPYFDQVRGGLQQLMGILAGMSADHYIHPTEASRLADWTEEWSHLKGLWPFDECESLVTAMLTTEQWTDEPGRLMDLSRQFPIAGEVDKSTGEVPPTLIGGICAVGPVIEFEERRFVFTGASDRCDRAELHAHVAARAGIPEPNVTRRTHYLVVCPEGSPYWAFACYGRKVEAAYKLRQKGLPLQIVHEVDFWDALAV